jgi:hypothetical protein
MPSTYTLNNGIELIATGEQSGTWGDTTNTNMSLLDTALDGQVTVTLASAGTSGSPNTLPISDGAVSDGRNRMVIFNDGADLGATAYVQLTPNDAEKIVYIRNALSGSRSIIVFQGTYNASNDYEIPAGTTAVVYFNGGGTGAVAANVFNNAYFDSLRLGGVSVTAILDEDDMSSDSATSLATQQSIKAYVDSQVGTVDTLAEILANGNTTGGTDISVTTGDDITFADSSKAIFGAGSDLQLYHDGSTSFIDDVGDGNLHIRTDGASIKLRTSANADMIVAENGGAAKLYHAGSQKLATLSTGIDVTGTVVSDGLTSAGDVSLEKTSAGASQGSFDLIFKGTNSSSLDRDQAQINSAAFGGNTNAGELQFYTSNSSSSFVKRMDIDGVGDITFYDTSGNSSFVYYESSGSVFNEQGDNKDFRVESDTNTHAFFLQGSDGFIGLGESSPQGEIHIRAASPTIYLQSNDGEDNDIIFGDASDQSRGRIRYDSSENMIFQVNNLQERLKLGFDNVTVNEGSYDVDFRVESNNNTHMLFVDAGNDRLLIGKTAADTGVVGTQFRPDGLIAVTRDGDVTGIFNRNTSDGNIFTFRKDNVDVGALGTNGGDLFVGTGDTNLLFADGSNRIMPVTTGGATVDKTIDLGTNGGRFKDAYFRGVDITNDSDRGRIRLWANASLAGEMRIFNANGYGLISMIENHTLNFHTNSVERLELGSGEAVFNDVSNDVDFRVESNNNANMLFVDAGNDRVGVGTNAPASHLHLTSNADTVYTIETTNATADGRIQFRNSAGTDAGGLWYATNNNRMLFRTNSTEHMVLDNSGNLLFNQDTVIGANTSDASDNQALYLCGGGNQTVGRGANIRLHGNEDSPAGDALVYSGNVANSEIQLRAYTSTSAIRQFVSETDRLSLHNDRAVFNDESGDIDFRVESNTKTHALFVDGGTGNVLIGTSTVAYAGTLLNIGTTSDAQNGVQIQTTTDGNGYVLFGDGSGADAYQGQIQYEHSADRLTLRSGGAVRAQFSAGESVFNEGSTDTDFRVESDNNTHALFVDAGEDTVSIGTSSPPSDTGVASPTLNVSGSAQISSGYYTTFGNPNGRVFTLNTAGNGASAFIKLEGADHVGYRSEYMRCTNASGIWTITVFNSVTSGTAPTFTIANNSTANPTITLGFNTAYSGGYCIVNFGSPAYFTIS